MRTLSTVRGIRILALAVLPLVMACGKKSATAPSAVPTLQGIEIVGKQTFAAGETYQFSVLARYSDGTEQNVTGQVTWGTFESGLITISPSGLLTALAQGKCGVVARYQGHNAALPITVGPPIPGDPDGPGDPGDPPDPDEPGDPDEPEEPENPGNPPGEPDPGSLFVQGATTVAVGSSVSWQAWLSSGGATQNVTSQAQWSSANPGVASVSGGVVQGVSPGVTTISVLHDGLTASGQIQVTQTAEPPPTVVGLEVSGSPCTVVGDSAQLQATAQLSNGLSQNVTTDATWASGTPSVATVSGSGVVSCVGEGSTSVSATYQGQQDAVPVTVSAPPPSEPDLVGLELHIGGDILTGGEPSGAAFAAGGSAAFSAVAAAGPLETVLDLVEMINGNPIAGMTVYGLYSDGSKQNVTNLSTIDCVGAPPCIINVDQMGTADVVLLLIQGLLLPEHQVNAKYGGYTANVVVDLQLPVLQGIQIGNGGPVAITSGNQLPALQTAWSQGFTSNNDANTPGVSYDFELADGLLDQLGAVPIIGPLLIGPLTTQLNQVVDGLSVVDGVLQLVPGQAGTLESILDNQLFQTLGLSSVPVDGTASLNGVTSDPVRFNLGEN